MWTVRNRGVGEGVVHLYGGDLAQLVVAKGLKGDDVVEAVEELGAEVLFDDAHDQVLGQRRVAVLQQQVAAQVGGQDDHGVGKRDGAALGVCQPAIVQHSQQNIHHLHKAENRLKISATR